MYNTEEIKEMLDEGQDFGLVIHFTPVAIYLYVSAEGVISQDLESTGLDMEDLNGNYIGIDGSYITLELQSTNAIEKAIKQYGLDSFEIPIIKIPVRPREM